VLRPDGPSSSDAAAALLARGAIAVADQATLSAAVVLCATNSAAKRVFMKPRNIGGYLKCLDTSLMSSVKALRTGMCMGKTSPTRTARNSTPP